jgi:hypothetical protein
MISIGTTVHNHFFCVFLRVENYTKKLSEKCFVCKISKNTRVIITHALISPLVFALGVHGEGDERNAMNVRAAASNIMIRILSPLR